MNDKLVGKVSEYIDAIAAKLGVAAEHVYDVLLRQQVVDGVTTLVSYAVALPLIALSIRFLYKKSDKYDLNIFGILAIVMSVVFGLFLICGFVDCSDAVKKLANPEYYAIKEIIKAVK